jgi:alpha-galactosidase
MRLVFAAALFACACAHAATPPVAVIAGKGLRIEYDANLHSRIVALEDGREIVVGPYSASETLQTSTHELRDFAFDSQKDESVVDEIGAGRRFHLVGHNGSVIKSVDVSLYDQFPTFTLVRVTYTNRGTQALKVLSWTNAAYEIAASDDAGALWSYQSASYEPRPDWILPVKVGFHRDNFQGMNATDYGGGTPIVDVWRREIGIGVGHLELVPKLVSLPVARKDRTGARVAVRFDEHTSLAPGASLRTFRTFVSVHRGDYFHTLRTYRDLMVKQGVVLPKSPPSAFEPIWCAWGYGREFNAAQIEATIPVAKRLGFGWVTLDDGWQKSIGDWQANPLKYANGDADLKSLVAMIHAGGMKAQLWWSPLSVDTKRNTEPSTLKELLLNANHKPRDISWWDSEYQCPAYQPVRDEAAAFAKKAIGEWGFDGLKIDGQHLNAAPACFNPEHHHERPEESVEGVPGFFQSIWRASEQTRSDAVVEICPCGTGYSFFTLPFLNMTVASDPESSWQVRHKGKTLKALTGDDIAYFGDHVEMSEGGDDFASTIGVGGVVGSNFVWPGAPGKKDPKLLLTPEREREWAHWLEIYKQQRLPQGRYLGELYDIGFDRPEAHAIQKADRMYYAFYAPTFHGSIELRGLGAGKYRVHDYETDRDLGTVSGPLAHVEVTFSKHLLIEAVPVDQVRAD